MSTADVEAPADGASVRPGADDLLPLAAAAAELHVGYHTVYAWARLRKTIRSWSTRPTLVSLSEATAYALSTGRLPAGHPMRVARATEVARLYLDEEKSLREVADELGISKTTVRQDLVDSDRDRRNVGQLAKYPYPEERPCPCGRPSCRRLFTPRYPSHAANGRGVAASRSCAAYYFLWRMGKFSLDTVAQNWSARARRKWLGVKYSRKPPAAGAPPRGRPPILLSDDQVVEVERLLEANGKLGEREIAKRAGVTRYQVREIRARRAALRGS